MESRASRSPLVRTVCAVTMLAGFLALPAAAENGKYVHFTWQKPAEGVWIGITPPASFIGSNTAIFAIPNGALVVDAHITAYTANEIIAKAREVAGPVRYLVNSHFHNDRSGGNAAFKKAFPDIQIIGHRNTCWAEKEKAQPRWRWRAGELPKDVEQIKANISKVTDPKIKAGLQRIVAGNEHYIEDSKTFEYVYPNVCLDLAPGESKTIVEGEREIRAFFPGGAHTAGDLVVYLPKEKIIFSGALWSPNGSAGCDGRDGSLLQCPSTLRRVAGLDFDLVLPGGGAPFQGKKGLAEAIAKSEAFVQEVKQSYERGEYIEQTIAKMTPPTRPAGPTLSDYVPYMSVERYGENAGWKRAIIRLYEEIEFRKQNGMPMP
jgi:glyoxylase-like metal-dependent hydrolase (beta-lactamase superfamily II)